MTSETAKRIVVKFGTLVFACAVASHAVSQFATLSEAANDQKASVRGFQKLVGQIDVVGKNPAFARWRPDLVSLVVDAKEIFGQADAERVSCIRTKDLNSEECGFAYARESYVFGNLGAPASWSDPDSVKPWNDSKTIRSQVRDWNDSGFETARLRLAHSATDDSHLQLEITHAAALRLKAVDSLHTADWTGAVIALRHSQMLMQDTYVLALRKASLSIRGGLPCARPTPVQTHLPALAIYR